MGILGTIGSALGTARGVMGVVLKVIGFVPQIVEIVEKVASLFKKSDIPMTSEMKQELALSLIKDAFLTAEGFSEKDIVDEEGLNEALKKIIDGVVAARNSFGKE
jgi:hypothetical protein